MGNPPDIEVLLDICWRNRIHLILDGCDSLGTKWNDIYLNKYAVATSDSFYAAHHISTGEGGMITSDNKELIKLARSFSFWGRGCYCIGEQNLLPNEMCKRRFSNWLENYSEPIDHKYYFENMGYNLKPLDLQGAIGLVQLEKVDEIIEKRRNHYYIISELLKKNIPNIHIPQELPMAKTSWFAVPIVCPDKTIKQKLVSYFEKNLIQTRNYFSGNLLIHPAYQHLDDFEKYPNANQVLDRVLFIGCSPHYNETILDYIRKTIEDFKND